jgi:hypothetical protein
MSGKAFFDKRDGDSQLFAGVFVDQAGVIAWLEFGEFLRQFGYHDFASIERRLEDFQHDRPTTLRCPLIPLRQKMQSGNGRSCLQIRKGRAKPPRSLGESAVALRQLSSYLPSESRSWQVSSTSDNISSTPHRPPVANWPVSPRWRQAGVIAGSCAGRASLPTRLFEKPAASRREIV